MTVLEVCAAYLAEARSSGLMSVASSGGAFAVFVGAAAHHVPVGARKTVAAEDRRVSVLIDPARGSDDEAYRGATVVTPNRHETELAMRMAIRSAADALSLGHSLRQQKRGFEATLIKLDRDGMVLSSAGLSCHFPTTEHQVFDVTGAGDTVIAVLAMCLVSGQSWETACRLANIAGGVQVRHGGVAPISCGDPLQEIRSTSPSQPNSASRIMTLSQASRVSVDVQLQGKSVVYTNGCFAALHAGHVAFLQQARALGDVLIVACNSTASIRRLKAERPIIPDEVRLRILDSLDFVDGVLLFDDDPPHRLLRTIRPNCLLKEGTTQEIIGRKIVEDYGGRVIKLAALPGVSTTRLLAGSPPPLTRIEHSLPTVRDSPKRTPIHAMDILYMKTLSSPDFLLPPMIRRNREGKT